MKEHLKHLACHTIGCMSPFAYFSQWPHRLVCYHLAMPPDIRGEYLIQRANIAESTARTRPVPRLRLAYARWLRRRGHRKLDRHYGLKATQ